MIKTSNIEVLFATHSEEFPVPSGLALATELLMSAGLNLNRAYNLEPARYTPAGKGVDMLRNGQGISLREYSGPVYAKEPAVVKDWWMVPGESDPVFDGELTTRRALHPRLIPEYNGSGTHTRFLKEAAELLTGAAKLDVRYFAIDGGARQNISIIAEITTRQGRPIITLGNGQVHSPVQRLWHSALSEST